MEYRLLTLWRISAPREKVFNAISDSLQWPNWWPGAEQVEQISAGNEQGIGSLRRYVWKGRLPYRLSFVARTTAVKMPDFLSAEVDGDLVGEGDWFFLQEDDMTTVRYEWRVRTVRLWMNILGPVTHRIFAANHHAMMREGGEGLASHLNACLVGAYYGNLPRQFPDKKRAEKSDGRQE